MDRPFVGYSKKYADNYDSYFRKSFKTKVKEFINKLLVEIFLKDR